MIHLQNLNQEMIKQLGLYLVMQERQQLLNIILVLIICFLLFQPTGNTHQAIIIKDGGARNPVNEESLKDVYYGKGVVRRPLDSVMDGMAVFAFGFKASS